MFSKFVEYFPQKKKTAINAETIKTGKKILPY